MDPLRTIRTQTEIYPALSVLDVLLDVAAGRRTGSLKINFAGGKPDGTVEWTQRGPENV